jgi:rare lipoprotein A
VTKLRSALCAALAVGLALSWAPFFSACASSGTAGQAQLGGLSPYKVNGRTYLPIPEWRGYREEGTASWYGAAHHGKKTASGERFDANDGRTAAHKTLPFNVCVEVENLRTGKSVLVRINDRGPFAQNRLIDLSRAAASEIGLVRSGVERVRVEAVGVADLKGECRES